jgi:hypothetical protein
MIKNLNLLKNVVQNCLNRSGSIKPIIALSLSLFVFMNNLSCSSGEKQNRTPTKGYPISPVDLRDVKLTDGFWLPIVERIQENTIPYSLEKCREEGRFDNFLIS